MNSTKRRHELGRQWRF